MAKLNVHTAKKNLSSDKCPHCGSTEGFEVIGCGKARVRITKKGEVIKTGGKRKKNTPAISEKQKKEGTGFHLSETAGWTDCGCGASWSAGIVCDPFLGSGTTALVARKLGRNWIGIELSGDYIKIAKERLKQEHLGI